MQVVQRFAMFATTYRPLLPDQSQSQLFLSGGKATPLSSVKVSLPAGRKHFTIVPRDQNHEYLLATLN